MKRKSWKHTHNHERNGNDKTDVKKKVKKKYTKKKIHGKTKSHLHQKLPSNWLLSRERIGGFALVDGSSVIVDVSDVANSRCNFGAGGMASDSR